MDRNIPRDVQAVSVHADSAFRRNGQSPYRYRVFFNPNDSRTAERIKDVVSVGVERASLPTMHDNILPGINIVNLHVGVRTATATGAATTISDMASLIAYFAARNVELTLGASGTFLRSLHEQNVLLISDQETPGSTRAGDNWCLLATTQSTEWVTPTFPLDLALTACENHRVLLKPGFYPTHDQMIRELFDSFESMIPPPTKCGGIGSVFGVAPKCILVNIRGRGVEGGMQFSFGKGGCEEMLRNSGPEALWPQ